MIINLRLENNGEIEKQINDIIQGSIRGIVREELKSLVMTEVSKVSQNQVKQAIDQIPDTIRSLVKEHVATLLPPHNGDAKKYLKKELNDLLNFAFPKEYLELMMTGLLESTITQVAQARLDAIGSAETESVLRDYKNTIRENLKAFVNRV